MTLLSSTQFVLFAMPEVSGYPLERIKELFETKKWYAIGITQNRPLRVKDHLAAGDDVPQLRMEGDLSKQNSNRQSQDFKEDAGKQQDTVVTVEDARTS